MYICSCHAVTDGAIKKAVKEGGIRRFRDLAKLTGVSTQCGICGLGAKEIFDKAIAELPETERPVKRQREQAPVSSETTPSAPVASDKTAVSTQTDALPAKIKCSPECVCSCGKGGSVK